MSRFWGDDRLHCAIASVLLLILTRCSFVSTDALQLKSDNIDQIIESNELVLINFYADWCRFSQLLKPVYDDAADKIHEIFVDTGKVVIGKVDCDYEANIASKYQITKYPTLKLIVNGHIAKREYRGQRSVEAFIEFIEKYLKNQVIQFNDLSELSNLDDKKRMIIGFFVANDTGEYDILRRVATNLKDDCQFYVGFGNVTQEINSPGRSMLVFRPDKALSSEKDELYLGNLTDYIELKKWAEQKCIPLVREITFENAEELTEEGLPFLILFYDPNNTTSIKDFRDIITDTLESEKQKFNFLTADGYKFAHPLHHLGKSEKDLPLIAIDSFRHMYLFPNYEDIFVSGKLKTFLQDLHSGKLHREFHYGPVVDLNTVSPPVVQTNPPISTFKKLGPSKNRYTLLRDEL